MKRILLFLVLVSSFCGYSQTTVYWRADGPSDGSWLSGSTCEPSGDGQWF
ncbi:hypothetical protein [Flavobacterium solisilvae]|uniref:Secreted protein n=1 Tax=Flavobacterium solisilvae TaxID=1852019 RepID=A0ABX1QQJ9_9FLAO|nr:hypothetical protein [Flavobacterium solisilvae]NMH24485.1 hypothetical protein [Flavobacterium solisilvae]